MYTAKKFDWRIFFILLAAATFGVIAISPLYTCITAGTA